MQCSKTQHEGSSNKQKAMRRITCPRCAAPGLILENAKSTCHRDTHTFYIRVHCGAFTQVREAAQVRLSKRVCTWCLCILEFYSVLNKMCHWQENGCSWRSSNYGKQKITQTNIAWCDIIHKIILCWLVVCQLSTSPSHLRGRNLN